jgi:predicted DNA-binding transcriptional regulator YafY
MELYFKDISQLIHFTEEEAYILKSAIESIDENNLLKQNLKRKLSTVYNYKILAETVVRTQNARNVNKIIEAIENRQIIVLKNYRSSNSQNVRDRRVEPFSFTTNYIQLWAFDVESGTNKLFNLNRIETVEILSEKWKYADRHQAGFIDISRISIFEQLPVKLRLGMLSASLLTEEYPLAEKYLTKVSDNEFILETNVCSYEGVGRFVLGLLSDIEIIENEDFKEFVKRELEKYFEKINVNVISCQNGIVILLSGNN